MTIFHQLIRAAMAAFIREKTSMHQLNDGSRNKLLKVFTGHGVDPSSSEIGTSNADLADREIDGKNIANNHKSFTMLVTSVIGIAIAVNDVLLAKPPASRGKQYHAIMGKLADLMLELDPLALESDTDELRKVSFAEIPEYLKHMKNVVFNSSILKCCPKLEQQPLTGDAFIYTLGIILRELNVFAGLKNKSRVLITGPDSRETLAIMAQLTDIMAGQ